MPSASHPCLAPRPGAGRRLLAARAARVVLAALALAGLPALAAARPGHPAPEPSIRFEDANGRLDRPIPEGAHSGATWVDLEGDGDLDLTVPTLPTDVHEGPQSELVVWRQENGRFTDATAALGLSGILFSRTAVWLDLDGDRDLDLYVTRMAEAPSNLLFENVDGVMRLRSEGLGFDTPATDVSQAWADYDGDGDPDLYLPGVFVSRSRLLRNDGGFRFTDVSAAAGLDTTLESFCAAWGDFDGDGDPDLATGETFDFHVFHNDAGRFVDVTPDFGDPIRILVQPSWGDVDGDGDLDLYVGHLFPPHVYENRFEAGADPGGWFVDRNDSWGFGLEAVGGGVWADVDLDGDLDLLADGGGIGTSVFENRLAQGEPLRDVTAEAGLPSPIGITWLPTAGDFDGDGRIDFFSAHEVAPALYRNVSRTAGDAVTVVLAPESGNVPLGARVEMEMDGRVQMREVAWPASGFSFPSPEVVLAVGARRTVAVDVRWASGRRERFHGLHAGARETLVEGRGQPVPRRGRGRETQALRSEDAAEPSAAGGPRLSCNPCRAAVRLRFADGAQGEIGFLVQDVRGRVVRELAGAGGEVAWDLRDDGGRRVRPGIYWLRRLSPGAEPPARVVVLP